MEALKLYDTSAVIELIVKKKVDVIPGLITIFTAIEYPPSVTKAVEILYPTKDDYALAIKWQVELRKRGTPLPAVDLVIAAMAYNNGLELITLDKHFTIIQEIEPKIRISYTIPI